LDKYRSRQIHYTKFNKERDELEPEVMEKMMPIWEEICKKKLAIVEKILTEHFIQ
jgi:hypothetical protein